MKITFLRHGESELNMKGVYYGQLDPSLTDKGRKQIVEVREKLGEFKKIYVSPLKRARNCRRRKRRLQEEEKRRK